MQLEVAIGFKLLKYQVFWAEKKEKRDNLPCLNSLVKVIFVKSSTQINTLSQQMTLNKKKFILIMSPNVINLCLHKVWHDCNRHHHLANAKVSLNLIILMPDLMLLQNLRSLLLVVINPKILIRLIKIATLFHLICVKLKVFIFLLLVMAMVSMDTEPHNI